MGMYQFIRILSLISITYYVMVFYGNSARGLRNVKILSSGVLMIDGSVMGMYQFWLYVYFSQYLLIMSWFSLEYWWMFHENVWYLVYKPLGGFYSKISLISAFL